jgi:hypothetical protein
VRGISKIYSPYNSDVDFAILKVNSPFVFTNFIQAITLAPAEFIPPGKKLFVIFQRCKVQFKGFTLPYL